MKINKDFWYKNWPRVGIIVAVFSLIFLFFYPSMVIGSIDWLYWLCIPMYMIHQFEEYVYPGGFQREINQILSIGDSTTEILTSKDTFFINIIFIWVLTPVLIILGYFSVIFPIVMITIVGVNGTTHLIASIRFRKYNAGLILSLVFNLPLSIYILVTLSITSATWLQLLVGVLVGIILHGALFIFLIMKARRVTKKM
jgi:hypothetical protein